MDPFRKYIITQIIKQTGKIPRTTSLIDNAVSQLKIRLKNAGENISKYTDPKQITQFFNKEKSYWNQQVEQAIKAKDIGTKFSKQKGPFEGFKPKIVPKPKDIKSKLEKQNKESIQRFKDKMKNPEDLAGGGIAGMLGEPTYQDDNHRVPLRFGKGLLAPKSGPLDWWDLIGDEMDPDEWEDILKSVGAYQDGGRVPLSWGGFLMRLLQGGSKAKPFNVKDFVDKREFILSLIGQGSKQRNKRLIQEMLEENKKVKGFKFPDLAKRRKEIMGDEEKAAKDFEMKLQEILAKHSTKHAEGGRVSLSAGGLAGMLGE